MRNWNDTTAAVRARWAALSPRERYLSSLAMAAVGILLVWAVALAPALRTLAGTEVRRNALNAQQQRMLALQAEARRLQAQPRAGYDESLRALQASVAQGLPDSGQLSASGDRAIVSLRGATPEALSAWLVQARANARALPVEAKLARSAPRSTSQSANGGVLPGAGPMGLRPAVAPVGSAPPPDFSQNAPVVTAPGVLSAGSVGVSSADVRWDGSIVLGLPAR